MKTVIGVRALQVCCGANARQTSADNQDIDGILVEQRGRGHRRSLSKGRVSLVKFGGDATKNGA